MTNREIDALIAEKVMGWDVHSRNTDHWVDKNDIDSVGYRAMAWVDEWKPTKQIGQAWRVFEKMSETYPDVSICKSRWTKNAGYYECVLKNIEDDIIFVEAETAPMAICLAALKAIGIEIG